MCIRDRDNSNWDESTLNWKNAPNLEKDQVRVTDVGNAAHVAGEIVVTETVMKIRWRRLWDCTFPNSMVCLYCCLP